MKKFEIREGLFVGIKEGGRVVIAQESWKRDNTFTEIYLNEKDVLDIAEIVKNNSKNSDIAENN